MTFDFKIISEKYPKSFEKLKEWIYDNAFSPLQVNLSLNEHAMILAQYKAVGQTQFWAFNPLELTAFFDEQNIIGDVYLRLFDIEDHYAFAIHYYSKGALPSPQSEENKIQFPTRELALAECWNKCFQVLEERLP